MQRLRLLEQPLGLGEVAAGLVDAHRLAGAGLGAQVLAQAPAVVADQRIRGVQDVAEAAVVLLQLDDLAHAVLALEVGHVADPRAAEGVDALVVVADGEHALPAPRWREHLQPGVLQLVGVLELVDQHVLEAALVMLAHRLVVAHQLVGAQHQLGEVDHAFAGALVLVGLVDVHQLAGLLVAQVDVLGPQAVFLGAGDEPGHLLRNEALLVQVHRLDHALDGGDGVARVQDLEALRQAGQLPVRAQEAVAQAVEGADPHAAHVHRQHRGQAGDHLLGGLVGEGHRHHAGGRGVALAHQPGDARGQHAGLARAGARQDQRGLLAQRHRGVLFGVEVVQQPARHARCEQIVLRRGRPAVAEILGIHPAILSSGPHRPVTAGQCGPEAGMMPPP